MDQSVNSEEQASEAAPAPPSESMASGQPADEETSDATEAADAPAAQENEVATAMQAAVTAVAREDEVSTQGEAAEQGATDEASSLQGDASQQGLPPQLDGQLFVQQEEARLRRRGNKWTPPLLRGIPKRLAFGDSVMVPRSLLWDVLKDGTCPLHLRVRLEQAVRLPAAAQSSESAPSLLRRPEAEDSRPDAAESALTMESIPGHCFGLVVSMLSLPEVLTFRASAPFGLAAAMESIDTAVESGAWSPSLPPSPSSPRGVGADGGDSGLTPLPGESEVKVHDRIRARLWIQRVADLTLGTADETIFETQVRSYANDALRRRMEAEMAHARHHMERQIHNFQGEVSRRMEEQALRVHAIVEERVQQQLDNILAAEMEKVRGAVEERVQERVRLVVQREVQATVSDVHVRLMALARENDRLRNAFAEHADLCFRSLVSVLRPEKQAVPSARWVGALARMLQLTWCCHRRLRSVSAWVAGGEESDPHVESSTQTESRSSSDTSSEGLEALKRILIPVLEPNAPTGEDFLAMLGSSFTSSGSQRGAAQCGAAGSRSEGVGDSAPPPVGARADCPHCGVDQAAPRPDARQPAEAASEEDSDEEGGVLGLVEPDEYDEEATELIVTV